MVKLGDVEESVILETPLLVVALEMALSDYRSSQHRQCHRNDRADPCLEHESLLFSDGTVKYDKCWCFVILSNKCRSRHLSEIISLNVKYRFGLTA